MNLPVIYTIGHSNRSTDEFVSMLNAYGVNAIADVRSQPYSRFSPQFNAESLSTVLKKYGIAYVQLGRELGARRCEGSCYVGEKAQYELIESSPLFKSGIERVRKGANTHTIALMCSEKDPLTCHRTVLVARTLKNEFQIRHLISVDSTESTEEIEMRLLRMWGLDRDDFFMDYNSRIEEAYSRQGNEIAFVREGHNNLRSKR